MSNPASRERIAAVTQSDTIRSMSHRSIRFGVMFEKSLAICDGAGGGSRVSQFSPCAPECESSIPASDPCLWAASGTSARWARSWSSHIRAEMNGVSSASSETVQYSVQTAAQPPSALTARWAACDHGFSTPKPVQWGTW